MRLIIFVLLSNLFLHCSSKTVMTEAGFSYLALGDSYTIGESVPTESSFPLQVVEILKQKGINLKQPQIIAKTGWTTANLQNAITQAGLKPPYDVVTLLIGVNNQFQGRSREEYAIQFEQLLLRSIQLAGNDLTRVFVLSIPDYGSTPFSASRNRTEIGEQIDSFNAINRNIAVQMGVTYIDITPGSREAISDLSLVAADGLHPSAKEYRKWALKLADSIEVRLK
ncbi:MAG TPA: SGNH/GDSL hydrolase family protein [Flavitalea sp.]|nr:SGNH/GDSL hydrolase family protein [Flavitalea sp.]